MTLAPTPIHVAAGPDPAILAAIHRPEINLAVLERTLSDAVRADLAALDLCCAADLRVTLPTHDLDTGLPAALAEAGWSAPALAADIATLARHLADTMAVTILDIRLEAVTGDACRKFHADHVPARLVTTYRGPGTEWLPAGETDPERVRRLAAGAVGLFKGRTWPGADPIIHRSPPIAGTGLTRVVLVINPGPPPMAG